VFHATSNPTNGFMVARHGGLHSAAASRPGGGLSGKTNADRQRLAGRILAGTRQRSLASAGQGHSAILGNTIQALTRDRHSHTQFSGFGLCGRPCILAPAFGAPSPHRKIPFPAVGRGCELLPHSRDFRANVIRDLGAGLKLFRIKSERLELPAPFRWRIAKPFNADAAGQATFYGGFDKMGSEEGERMFTVGTRQRGERGR
jgi:hypothetical protein